MSKFALIGMGVLVAAAGIFYFTLPKIQAVTYNAELVAQAGDALLTEDQSKEEAAAALPPPPAPFTATHLTTPVPLKAIYMTSWVAGTPSLRAKLVNLVDTTEINAVIIDIKDYTGKISYTPTDPELIAFGSSEKRIPDIREFIAELHGKGIYVIGRIAAFQDPYFITKYPDEAVKKSSDKTVIWRDYKGIPWIDSNSKKAWDYLVAIGKDAYAEGFDEINYDYIRFPSDGNMRDIYFPISGDSSKPDAMKAFFEHLHASLAGTGPVLSADLFGMVATNTDDLGIGQVLEDALPNFDYVSPMVYPSHFPKGWNGFKNPADHPYDVIKITMDKAAARAEALGMSKDKIRPWLQDFDMGAVYTADMVRAQITATNDAGLSSWMLWDASNHYTKAALLPN